MDIDLNLLAVRMLLPDAPAISRELPLRVVQAGVSGGTPFAFVEFAGTETLVDRIAGAVFTSYNPVLDWNTASNEIKAPYIETAKNVIKALS